MIAISYESQKLDQQARGRDVTLSEIGCYDQVTSAISGKRAAWKTKVEQFAKSSAMKLPCNKTKVINLSGSVGANAGIFWIRGFSLGQKADCVVSKKCCDQSKMCCLANGSVSFNCSLSYSMHDPWEDPLDWKDKGEDFWDHWQFGTTKFFVDGTWSDSVSGYEIF